MNIIPVKICPMYSDVEIPKYQTAGSAGCDVRAYLKNYPGEELRLYAGQIKCIPTGLKFAVPEGYELQIRPRSGLSLKTYLRIANSPGTLDSDYRGELMIILHNTDQNVQDCEGFSPYHTIKHGDRIAQLIFAPAFKAEFDIVSSLDDTVRGAGGYGSTGMN